MNVLARQQPSQRDLRRRGTLSVGNLVQQINDALIGRACFLGETRRGRAEVSGLTCVSSRRSALINHSRPPIGGKLLENSNVIY